jgi:hypothetical protein
VLCQVRYNYNNSVAEGLIVWPKFSYEEFKESGYMLHMLIQAIGKLKLLTPFEPQWSNVPLSLTSSGLTTGIIPYKTEHFSVDLNFVNDHEVICVTSLGKKITFKLVSCSVSEITAKLFAALRALDIQLAVNQKPQEVPNPINFDVDTTKRVYQPKIVHSWWEILRRSEAVIQRYHAKFIGKTPPVALMWGTLDLRDVRFNGRLVKPTGPNTGYLRRNAMDAEQIEIGWWGGNELYPRAAYYSFTYPQPEGIEDAKILPSAARWDPTLSEFILDYDDLIKSSNPEQDLLDFCYSTYQAGATRANWDPLLIGTGFPV